MTSMQDYEQTPERNIGTQSHSELRAEGWDILQNQFDHKSLVTKPYDLTYGYYLSPNFHQNLDPNRPVLLLLHGFPDDAYMWASTLPTLIKLPYPIVILDLLAYASSSKPTDPTMYTYTQQVGSLVQILDREGVPNNVIPVGHDWGSAVAQRFYLYNKDRCVGLAPMSLFFFPPSDTAFNMPSMNRETHKRFGYPQWEYWIFFTAEDGPELMEKNIERFYEALHGNYPSPWPEEKGRDIWMRELFCVPGAMREYVTGVGKFEVRPFVLPEPTRSTNTDRSFSLRQDYRVPLKPYAEDPELKRYWINRLTRDGLEAPVCYYSALKQNINISEDREFIKDPNFNQVTKPYLYISFTGDWVPRTDLNNEPVARGLITDFEQYNVRAGHWSLYEKPQEIAEILADWLKRQFPVPD